MLDILRCVSRWLCVAGGQQLQQALLTALQQILQGQSLTLQQQAQLQQAGAGGEFCPVCNSCPATSPHDPSAHVFNIALLDWNKVYVHVHVRHVWRSAVCPGVLI